MPSEKLKLLVIVGPTASGKSELAVAIAKTVARKNLGGFRGAEIISADSRQIYRGLDIGTAKVPGRWTKPRFGGSASKKAVFMHKGIPHHCIDFVSPKKFFSVAEFRRCAEAAIQDISGRGKLPIVAGGTGFWIDALVSGTTIPAVPPNPASRKKLEKKSARELLALLTNIDPRRSRSIEKKNPRRLIRAIEVARALGRVPPMRKRSPYEALWIGIRPDEKVLAQRIKTRSGAMARRGLGREVKILREKKTPKKRLREFGFEYRLALEAEEGTISKKELAEQLTRETLRYALRQTAWWKKNRAVRWIKKPSSAAPLLKNFLKSRIP